MFKSFSVYFLFYCKTQDEEEVAPENELSALVNYIQPVHFKNFEAAAGQYTYIMLFKCHVICLEQEHCICGNSLICTSNGLVLAINDIIVPCL